MNLSGNVLKKVAEYYDTCINDIIVIHDDLDLRIGTYKFTFGKGPKQHNGIRNIEENFDSTEFYRVRVGIDGREEGAVISGKDYVLSRLQESEIESIMSLVPEIIERIENEFLRKDNHKEKTN